MRDSNASGVISDHILPAWRQHFSHYRIAVKLEDSDVQVNGLLYAMGKDAEPIFSTFTFGDDEDDYYNEVINKFNRHAEAEHHPRTCMFPQTFPATGGECGGVCETSLSTGLIL